MKKLFFLSTIALLVIAINPLMSQKIPEKKPDLSEFTLDGIRSVQQVSGQFNDLTPVFSRASNYGLYQGICLTADIIYPEDFKYDVYTIKANSNGLLVLTLERIGDYDYCPADMYVYCYCHPFDPVNPDLNYYFEDDDDGGSYNAAFTPADNIQLVAGQYYDIVCTHWCAYEGEGLPQDYVLTIDADVNIEGITPVQTPLSNWAIGIGIFLILTVAVIRMKRFV